MPDYSDIDRRLDALVQIAASQSQSLHEMNAAIDKQGQQIDKQGQQIDKHTQQIDKHTQQIDKHTRLIRAQTRHIMERGRQIDRIIDAFMGLSRDSHDQQRSIDSHEQRITRIENEPPEANSNA